MAWRAFDRFWHQALKRPYYLARPVDAGGQGDSVVLLHGIGRTARVWQQLVPLLSGKGFRVVAMDMLGFGASPKPGWLNYDADDHARAVISTIEKMRLPGPLIIVGHSMGCLVAVRVARLRPDLVKHLVLFEMPLYNGLPYTRGNRWRTELYMRLYNRIIAYKPNFDEAARLVERVSRRIIGQEITPETWEPFVLSLKHTIMEQSTAEDIKHVQAPIDVIYGRFDMLVIRGQPQHIFGEENGQITAHTIGARHEISPRSSRFLAARIEAASKEPASAPAI